MTWFFLSLLTALAVASCDTGVKKWFSHLSHYAMILYPLIYALPLMLLCIPFMDIPPLDRTFYIAFIGSIPLTIVPLVLYMKAIKLSPLSLTVPYLAFTPVFMIGTGYFLLGETVDRWGLAGIASVCVGSYVLNIDLNNRSFWAPLRAVFRETGSWLMFIVAFLFSFSAVTGKLAIVHSSALFFQVWFFIVLTGIMILLFGARGKIRPATFRQSPGKGAIVGLFMFLHIISHGFAIAMTKAAYMLSIKRLSILFSIIYGALVFKEENIPVRFTGALLMFAGACLIFLKAG